MHVWVRASVQVCMHACMHAYTCTCVHDYNHVLGMYMYVHMPYVHTYVRTLYSNSILHVCRSVCTNTFRCIIHACTRMNTCSTW